MRMQGAEKNRAAKRQMGSRKAVFPDLLPVAIAFPFLAVLLFASMASAARFDLIFNARSTGACGSSALGGIG